MGTAEYSATIGRLYDLCNSRRVNSHGMRGDISRRADGQTDRQTNRRTDTGSASSWR